jgi:hypothetical protein
MELDDLDPGDFSSLGSSCQPAEDTSQQPGLTNSSKDINIARGIAHATQPTDTLQSDKSIHPYNFGNGLLLSDEEIVFPPWENMEVFADFSNSTWSFLGVPAVSNDSLPFETQIWTETRLSAQQRDLALDFAPDSLGGQWSGEGPSKIAQRMPHRASSFSINDHVRDMLIRDTESRLRPEDHPRLRFPSTKLLNRFLGGYFVCFHPHYPIFHIPSMVIENTPGPLILAICTIGALYRLDRKHAALLQQWADLGLSHVSV